MATNVWYLLILSIVTFCYEANAFQCYVGQASISSPTEVTGSPVSYQTCPDGSDVCLTIQYDIAVSGLEKSYKQGVCGSSIIGCSTFCDTLSKQMVGALIRKCTCSDTNEENEKMKNLIHNKATPANAFQCYVGQASTSSPTEVTGLPVSYQTCPDGSDVCLTLQYDIAVSGLEKSYKQGVCGSSTVGCSTFCDTLSKQMVGALVRKCTCSDTKEENEKMKSLIGNKATTDTPAVLLQCYVGQASTTPPYERSSVNKKTCAKDEDACITLQYKVKNGSNELSFTQGVCGVSHVGCPIFCQGMETQVGASNFKDCQCHNTKDENNKMAQFMENDNGSRAAMGASQEVLTIIVLSLFSLLCLSL